MQTRFLPLQWAIESVSVINENSVSLWFKFIGMATRVTPTAPLNWEYTNETQEERSEGDRLCGWIVSRIWGNAEG